MKNTLLALGGLCSWMWLSCTSPEQQTVWNIGTADGSTTDLALGPDGYKQFLANDFGFEDRYFLIGKDEAKVSFPYILPGPADEWGGTWSTAGWRTHDIHILFGIDRLPEEGDWMLNLHIADNAPNRPPLLKIAINGQIEKHQFPAGGSDSSLVGKLDSAKRSQLLIPIKPGILREGGNQITLSVLEGSWIMFDHVGLEGPERRG